ncbi:hypothetical protein A3D00_04590 [Candidatus Woesebacteria bacterium RIFCSPHIGHO2_02_FULL_38_9]|uniref:Uncharacterized protein n=1 Tax=Candidatus Woesebacteria bacterium RIFCSPHIGHO2_01_FULL_39_28 TaxID=1802496 RepID=A0A1F7YL29_9BACT|nr:MAG: hypothetical protein A2627_00410 [Candidatus Woesebacteria bacterium RIFCSPHIGHO2_01_FULL_39_28]OGM31905.1 MAG: hypothetical protein A3D00_04590 [Candidatus Woesebacteria bacterium RIFCSPHIGHO2_02_FULL_38_9]OGM56725.1 MAG: hypothetical protein A3A50_05210 [Candidatus Woesebacteria bacterium RIFCSPLOWO2_01_FULL_38_20]
MPVPSDKFILDNSLLDESNISFREAMAVVQQEAEEYYERNHGNGKIVTDVEKELLAAKGLSIAHDVGYAAGFMEADRRNNFGPERSG